MSIPQYIKDLKNLPEPRKTFMEIMKAHQSEVHMANILAYFLRSEEKHGLGKVFIKALLETNCYSLDFKEKASIGNFFNQRKKIPKALEDSFIFEEADDEKELEQFVNELSRVHVKLENRTDNTDEKNKRIDLVLTTDECVICIEFKINHKLNNPLETYQNQICKIEKKFQEGNKTPRDLFFVVLTPSKKVPSNSVQNFIEKDDKKTNMFSQIILSHFIKNVSKRIPSKFFIENATNHSTQYLIDLIQTINNREVRFKRSEILKNLQDSLIKSGAKCVPHSNKKFIEIKNTDSIFKIRIKNNHQFQIEKWSKNNKLEKTFAPLALSCSNEYKAVVEQLDNINATIGITV